MMCGRLWREAGNLLAYRSVESVRTTTNLRHPVPGWISYLKTKAPVNPYLSGSTGTVTGVAGKPMP